MRRQQYQLRDKNRGYARYSWALCILRRCKVRTKTCYSSLLVLNPCLFAHALYNIMLHLYLWITLCFASSLNSQQKMIVECFQNMEVLIGATMQLDRIWDLKPLLNVREWAEWILLYCFSFYPVIVFYNESILVLSSMCLFARGQSWFGYFNCPKIPLWLSP
jgi:hypothetical protein